MTMIVSYGCATVPPGGGVPTIALEDGVPLRLGGAGYAFAEPPNLAQLRDAAARLAVVVAHLKSLCDPWARAQHRFLDAYVAVVQQRVAAQADALAARLAPFGGLYAVADFCFAALRPLPRAHLAAGSDALPVDFAFWTGRTLLAIDLVDGRRTRRQREAAAETLRAAGAQVLALPPELDAGALARSLPEPLRDFCAGVDLPPSPFAAVRLGPIVDTPI
ncbi:MAG: hypothetical protein JO021_14350 [Alphaproteobacteria bacterium]|nr:hypothetical protein [Alphaproteobacteria bacterium]